MSDKEEVYITVNAHAHLIKLTVLKRLLARVAIRSCAIAPMTSFNQRLSARLDMIWQL